MKLLSKSKSIWIVSLCTYTILQNVSSRDWERERERAACKSTNALKKNLNNESNKTQKAKLHKKPSTHTHFTRWKHTKSILRKVNFQSIWSNSIFKSCSWWKAMAEKLLVLHHIVCSVRAPCIDTSLRRFSCLPFSVFSSDSHLLGVCDRHKPPASHRRLSLNEVNNVIEMKQSCKTQFHPFYFLNSV